MVTVKICSTSKSMYKGSNLYFRESKILEKFTTIVLKVNPVVAWCFKS